MNRKKFEIPKIFVAIFFIFLLFSCHDVIFDDIKKEVSLVNASVTGSIHSLVRQTVKENGENHEYLYLSNGDIFRKNFDSETTQINGTLFTKTLEPPGTYTVNLASDGDFLYAISIILVKDDDEGETVLDSRNLYALNLSQENSKWEKIDLELSKDSRKTCVLFCTNSVNPAHRKAFLNNNGNIFSLSNGNANQIFNANEANENSSSESSEYENFTKDSRFAAFFGSKIFFNSKPILTNEIYETKNSTEILKSSKSKTSENLQSEQNQEATKIYFFEGATLNFSSDLNAPFQNKNSAGTHSDVNCMALTKDSIIFGTKNGIRRVKINEDGNPESNKTAFDTNASSALSDYYSIGILFSRDCTHSEKDSEIYASTEFDGTSSSTSAQFKRIGLWSYYPTRGNWNRE